MYEYSATVIKVIDGDTVDLAIDLGLRIFHQTRVRLAGINAPELSTESGKQSKARLQELLPIGASLTIRTIKDKREKYGRYLGVLIDSDGHEVNQRLVQEGLAEVYAP